MTKPISDEPNEADRIELGRRAAEALKREQDAAKAAIAGRQIKAELRKAAEQSRRRRS